MSTEQQQQLRYLLKGAMAFVFAVGLFFLLNGLIDINTSRLLDYKGLVVIGKIDKISENSNTDADCLSFEVLFTYTGKHHRILNRVSDMQPIYKLGDTVEVIFFRNSPEDAIINSVREKYSGNTITIILGLLTCIGGAYLFFNSHLLGKMEGAE